MKKKIFLIITSILFIFPSLCFSEIQYFDVRDEVVSAINHLRADPLFYVNTFNLELSLLQEKWAGYDISMMRQLNPSEELTLMAKKHIKEMVNSNFIGHNSINGLTLEERANNSGYSGIFIGESIAVLAFENFISPEEGLNKLLNNLIKDALLQQSAEGVPLLFPLYEDVGVGFAGATMKINENEYNVYILCIDFGIKNTGGYFIGRVYREGSLPLPETGIGGVDIYFWEQNEMFFSHHKKTLPDGTFYFPVSSTWWWVYINSPPDYAKIFQESNIIDFIKIPE